VYVGTAWICGIDKTNRVVHETESPNPDYRQLVEYCRSKTIGEIMLRQLLPADKLLVVRPSTIIGDSRPWTPRSYAILWALAGFEKMRLLTMRPDAQCDVIPVDYAAEAITRLLFVPRTFDTYHISAGTASATPISRIMQALDLPGRPPFVFVDYDETAGQIKQLTRKKLPEDAELFRKYRDYIEYWKEIVGGHEQLRILLGGLDYYFRFVNLNLVFDNSRLLTDSGLGPSEPAQVYMARNRLQLNDIDLLSGATDP
jgi:nucleoside-diphosphate-sugar epimerase